MSRFLQLRLWQSALLLVFCAGVALFCAGQAVTYAWLSSFPERAIQLSQLRFRFWSFVALFIVSTLGAFAFAYLTYRSIKKSRRSSKP